MERVRNGVDGDEGRAGVVEEGKNEKGEKGRKRKGEEKNSKRNCVRT